MKVMATGQLTIIDYNDAPALQAIINANSTRTQGYNPDAGAYVPDWTTVPLKLTATLNKIGDADDIVNSPNTSGHTWYKWNQTMAGGAGAWEELSKSKTQEELASLKEQGIVATTNFTVNKNILTINENMVNESAWEFKFLCVYTDPTTGLTLPVEQTISFAKVVNGTGVADCAIDMPEGYIFRNSEPSTLPLVSYLVKGSVIEKDYNAQPGMHPNNFIAWFVSDSDGVGDSNFGVSADEGWSRIMSDMTFDQTTGRSTLKVPKDDVVGTALFMCVIKDPDSVGPGKTPIYYRDTATMLDLSDPIQVEMISTGGTVFKNGTGTTTLKARLIRNGVEIDAKKDSYSEQIYRYIWHKRGANGSKVPWYSDTQKTPEGNLIEEGQTREGKHIDTTGNNVDGKTIFECEVIEKEVSGYTLSKKN